MQLVYPPEKQFKIEKPGVVTYPQGQTDFIEFIKAIQEAAPDIFLHAGSRPESVSLIGACKKADFTPASIAFNCGITIPLFRAGLGNLSNNLIGSVQSSNDRQLRRRSLHDR